jgi:hypothetical protein
MGLLTVEAGCKRDVEACSKEGWCCGRLQRGRDVEVGFNMLSLRQANR